MPKPLKVFLKVLEVLIEGIQAVAFFLMLFLDLF